MILGLVGWRRANRGAGRKRIAVAGTILGAVIFAWAFVGSLIFGGALPR